MNPDPLTLPETVCATCGHAWFVPVVYFGADQERAVVPIASAKTEADAREHLLMELTDWSWHEAERADVTEDWVYRGMKSNWVCEHPIEEPCPRPRPASCRRQITAHMFEVV